ncbi:MAG: hypothetical protein R6U21_04630 [Thermoplasmatota archaeon]
MKRDETAIMSLPTYLLIIVVVTAIAIILLTMGALDLQKNLQKQQIENQLETIMMKAKTMSTAAVDETTLIISVDFPNQMKTAVFGAIPQENETNKPFFLRNNHTKKSLCAILDDHQQIIKHSSMLFSGESIETYAELPSGSYDIMLRLIQRNGETYVQVFKAG